VSIAAPGGNDDSAAAPVSGTYWNVVDLNTPVPENTTATSSTLFSANNQAASGVVRDSNNNLLSGVALAITYYSAVTTGSKTQPSGGTGENTIQPGGVMQNAWRNYYNASGNYFTYTLSGLPVSSPFGLYFYGGTTTSGQGAGLQLAAGNVLGANPGSAASANATANSNNSYGSIWTVAGGTTDLMLQGTSWNVLYGQSDASGNFGFKFNGSGNAAYLNGFQLVPLSSPGLTGLTNQTVIAGNNTTLNATATGLPVPALQWQTNGVNISGATNSSLALNNVQYSQNGQAYSLIASNLVGMVTNSMMLTVTVTPSVTGLTNQAVLTNSTAIISTVVSGIPIPSLQWQWNGTNLTDGATGHGSTLSGSASSTVTISNAQITDSGTYSLIASNSAGLVTNSMILTVASGNLAPSITSLANQTAVQGSNATFSASVTGLPLPALHWLENGTNIAGATSSAFTLTNVQFSQNGLVCSLIASNVAGMVTNSATLSVLVPVSISVQPTNLSVLNAQGASFSVTAGGVPAPSYQWYFSGNLISGATGSNYTITSVSPANTGNYWVVVTNSVNSVTSSIAALTVNSTMSPTAFVPANGATGVCYDTPLYVTFSSPPSLITPGTGKIRIYNVTNSTTPVDTLDMSQNVTLETPYAVNVQPRSIGGNTFTNFPVIITGNTAAIYPHLDLLTSNQTYYVTIDYGVFKDTNGVYFAGIAVTNTWQFTTKPSGPANPTNLVVATDGNGDFVTVQGAVDFVPAGSTTPRIVNIRNGTYTGIVNVNAKNNLDFRGQSRTGAVVCYPNDNNVNAGAPWRAMFVLNGNDCSFENLTLTNTTPHGGSQAEAIDVEGTRAIFYNMELDSYQDTFLINSAGSLAYFNGSLIQGDTDFNWGYGTVFYTNCELRILTTGGHVTQPRSPLGQNGLSFVNCQITKGSSAVTSADLGRSINTPTTPSEVIFSTCLMDPIVTGYASDAGTNFWAFSNSNLTATAQSTSLAYAKELTASSPTVAAAVSATNWLYGWSPQLAPNILTNPASQTVNAGQPAGFTVAATGLPAPTYQWLQNGTNAPYPTANSATLVIPDAQAASAGTYSVIVSNAAGPVTSSGATLDVVSPVAPGMSNVMRLGNGAVQFAISGPAESGYHLWATTNLAFRPVTNTWTLLTNATFGSSPTLFTDAQAGSFPQRFYIITAP
jgi:pectin methylesterase-like acyl-CoA thioesterase